MPVNKVILVGNVGKDPEIRYIENDTPVASFSLATSETYKNRNGEKVTNTDWHNIVVWRGLAQVVEKYVKKGTMLYIEGKIRTRSWDDKEGNKRYTTEIIADNLQMLGRKGENEQSSDPSSGNYQNNESGSSSSGENSSVKEAQIENNAADDEVDDLPF